MEKSQDGFVKSVSPTTVSRATQNRQLRENYRMKVIYLYMEGKKPSQIRKAIGGNIKYIYYITYTFRKSNKMISNLICEPIYAPVTIKSRVIGFFKKLFN